LKKIYVAGASAEVDLIAQYITKLEAAGYSITLNWTKSVLAYRAAGITEAALRGVEQLHYASQDLIGVYDADFVWLLAPAQSNTSVGAWVELGAAYARGIPVLVSHDLGQSIFTSLAFRSFETHDAALAWLVGT
jgi:hypothetical protein